MRRARSHEQFREAHLYPGTRTCPACQAPLRERYHKRRFIVRLNEQVSAISHFLECPTSDCGGRAVVYRPEEESLLALRGYTFGLDVIALIGELRFQRKRAIPEVHGELLGLGVSISEKEVSLLAEVFLALVSTKAGHDPAALAALRELGGLVIAIDGVQPEKGNETLYLIRELQSGRVLVARNLRSSSTPEIEKLIEEVLALEVPIRGVVSDKQESICLAIKRRLPKVPHQVCQYHYLRDLAQPVADADRHFKKELKKKVRGVKAIEDSVAKMAASPEARVVGDYCDALRVVMRHDGKYPLDPAGIELFGKLTKIRASVDRALEERGSKLLERVKRLLSVLDEFLASYEQVVTGYGYVWQIARLLETDAVRASTGQRRLLKYVEGLDAGEDELGAWIAHIQKLTRAFAPKLFEYVRQPLLPKTNNELEYFIGRIKTARRHATGRKNTQAYILREGQYVAILYGLPAGAGEIAQLAAVDFDAFRATLAELRRKEERSKAWKIRRDLDTYLAELEQAWPEPDPAPE